MALTSRVRAKLFDAIHVALDKIGNLNSTAMPPSKNNREAIAWEMMVSDEVRRRAIKRREAAFQAAKDAGLIPDYLAEPTQAHPKAECWRGEHVSILADIRDKKGSVDMDRFIANLQNAGVKLNLITKAYDQARKPSTLQSLYEALPIVVD